MNAILDHKKGDTWDGIEMFFEDSVMTNNVEVFSPKNLTGYSFTAKFKTSATSAAVFEFKTSDNTITILNPESGIIILMPRIMNVPAAKYIFDLQMTAPDGRVDTIYGVEKDFYWTILQDIS